MHTTPTSATLTQFYTTKANKLNTVAPITTAANQADCKCCSTVIVDKLLLTLLVS